MARHRMNIPINRLMKAIATPNVDSKVNIRLPDPGYDLFKNPFQEKEVGK